MYEHAQHQKSSQTRHSSSHARLNPAKSQRAAARNPFYTRHQALGNQVLQRLLRARGIQAKLKINEPDDKYEQEADRVAEQVMRMPAPQLQTAPS